MADDSTTTIKATFDTRAAADLAVECGEIEVSTDITASQIAAVQRSLGEAGAIPVSGG